MSSEDRSEIEGKYSVDLGLPLGPDGEEGPEPSDLLRRLAQSSLDDVSRYVPGPAMDEDVRGLLGSADALPGLDEDENDEDDHLWWDIGGEG